MTKSFNAKHGISLTLLFAAALLLFSGCNDDDDAMPSFDDPSISIVGDTEALLKPGGPISVNLALDGDGAAKSIIVLADGGFLEEIAVDADATEFTYTGQSVPAAAAEGDRLVYSFALVNTADVESASVDFAVSVAVYDLITIGRTEVYEVPVPTDNLVPAGTTVKFAEGRSYYISENLTFEQGSALEIGAGATVYLNADAPSPLEITVDGTVDIVGTANQPVVMTSSRTIDGGAPSAGDWTWFRLNGTGKGSNSGRISYLRIEYAGVRALRLVDVGSSTQLDHIQVFKTSGEGFMITDGDADLKYVVATDCGGGGFRLGDDYSGSIQFGIAVIAERFDDNFEVQIRETSSATLANFTLVGPGSEASNTSGMRLRANSAGKVYNSIIASFPRRGLRLNDNIEITDLNGPTVFAYSFIFDIPSDPFRDDTENGNPFQGFIDEEGNLQNPFFNNVTGFDGDDPILESIPGIGTGSFIPDSRQASMFDPSSLANGKLEPASYVGAVEDAASDWTNGWVKNTDGSIR